MRLHSSRVNHPTAPRVFRDLLADRPDGLRLAEMQVICVDLTKQHRSTGRSPRWHHALVMPVYATTLARLLHAPPEVVLAQGRHMQQALQYIHDRGYVHMDVKVRRVIAAWVGMTHMHC